MNFLYVSRGIPYFAEKPHIDVITDIIEVDLLNHNRKEDWAGQIPGEANTENCLVLSTDNY